MTKKEIADALYKLAHEITRLEPSKANEQAYLYVYKAVEELSEPEAIKALTEL